MHISQHSQGHLTFCLFDIHSITLMQRRKSIFSITTEPARELKYINVQVNNRITVWMCFWLQHKNSCIYLSGLIVKFSRLHQTIS